MQIASAPATLGGVICLHLYRTSPAVSVSSSVAQLCVVSTFNGNNILLINALFEVAVFFDSSEADMWLLLSDISRLVLLLLRAL